jgi:hypothetical protein
MPSASGQGAQVQGPGPHHSHWKQDISKHKMETNWASHVGTLCCKALHDRGTWQIMGDPWHIQAPATN